MKKNIIGKEPTKFLFRLGELAFWDILYMKNGEILKGRILGKQKNNYQLCLADTSEIRQISIAEIIRINSDFLRLKRLREFVENNLPVRQ